MKQRLVSVSCESIIKREALLAAQRGPGAVVHRATMFTSTWELQPGVQA